MPSKNPFSLTFGVEPLNLISRLNESEKIISEFESDDPSNYTYIITGLRGTGKTVLLSSISNYFIKKDDWIVIDPGTKKNLLENIASELYDKANLKKLFLKKEFSFSFHGISFSIEGTTPVVSLNTIIKKMLDVLQKKNIKVLIAIDEIVNNEDVKSFIEIYQTLIRNNYKIRLLMTGLYDNISKLQEDKSLTFLYRAPKLYLEPLNMPAIASSYRKLLNVDTNVSVSLAKLTNGYAYAYQVLGYLLYESNEKDINEDLLLKYDQYLKEYSYDKIFSELSPTEQQIIKLFNTNESVKISEIKNKLGDVTDQYFNVYRDKLIKKGVLISPAYGYLKFTLPRFNEFLLFN